MMQPYSEGTFDDVAKYKFEQAEDDLEAAKLLLEAGKYKAANNRAYYSCFHAIDAVLAKEPVAFKKYKDTLCNLEPDKLKECFEMILEALEKALRFIENNDLEKYNRSDYVNYLIGYFVFHKEKISEQQKNNLIDWYNNVTFTNKSNTTRRRIYSDLLNL